MQCTNPFRIKNPDRFKYGGLNGSIGPEWLEVPCGHCMSCRIARSREWAIRLLHENEFWEDSVYITLTYEEEFVSDSLVPSDLQKFWKRLRKDLDHKISYFACGEYGGRFGRPHFHAIVFGLSVKDRKIIKKAWPFGFVKLGCVCYESCRYVAGYVQKKLYGKEAKFYEEQGLVPPYSCCSKHLGEKYVDKYWNKLYQQETVTVGGIPMGLPRYYKKKLDYDGFLSYDVEKQDKKWLDFLERNHSYVLFLDEMVKSGEMSLAMATEELKACYTGSLIDKRLQNF